MESLEEIAIQLRRIADAIDAIVGRSTRPAGAPGYEAILQSVKGNSRDPKRKPAIAKIVFENSDKSIGEIGELLRQAGFYSPTTVAQDMSVLKWLKNWRESQ